MNREPPDVQLGFKEAEELEIKLPKWKKQGNSRKQASTSASLTMLTPLTLDHNKLWKILQVMGVPEHLTCLLRNLYAGKEATVRTLHGTMDWFKIGKGMSHMQSTSFEMPGWRKRKLESRLSG